MVPRPLPKRSCPTMRWTSCPSRRARSAAGPDTAAPSCRQRAFVRIEQAGEGGRVGIWLTGRCAEVHERMRVGGQGGIHARGIAAGGHRFGIAQAQVETVKLAPPASPARSRRPEILGRQAGRVQDLAGLTGAARELAAAGEQEQRQRGRAEAPAKLGPDPGP